MKIEINIKNISLKDKDVKSTIHRIKTDLVWSLGTTYENISVKVVK